VRDCGRSQQGLAIREQLRRAGLSPQRLALEVACEQVSRIRRRVYALAPLPAVPRFLVTDKGVAAEYVAHVRAALLSLGPTVTACGRTAAVLRGWAVLVEPARTVEVAVPHGRVVQSSPLLRVRQRRRLQREQVVVLPETASLWLTTATQTVVDCALTLPLLQAVVICDSALRAGAVTVDGLTSALRTLQGQRDAERARRVLELCDPEAGSVLESVLRVRMVLAGISGFATQVRLQARSGAHLLRVDFCFADARLVVEVDGQKWHQDVVRDRRLDNSLAALGWRVLRYTWAEVVHGSEAVLAEIAAALDPATNSVHIATDAQCIAA
jgi:very-short-patch-repair endonuclease